ncbi:hypothetical protein ABZ654_07100 [Streptomyces hygroscopicus]|uniref:hypothetical protein n=1 Tax=Streptomyces hygroscopicus TaxID=1912 RepID=UPI0033FC7044
MERSTSRLAATEQEALPPFDGMSRGQRALSPKRPAIETAGLADIFPYYAGFSFDWARNQLARDLAYVGDDALVLDPWNGSGTTTLAAQSLGLRAVGVDRNPIANVVARLRAEASAMMSAVHPPSSGAGAESYSSGDALDAWFTEETVRRIRDWFSALKRQDSSLNPVGTVALFRVIRRVTKGFEGSNPTWVKRAKKPEDRVTLSAVELDGLVVGEQQLILARMQQQIRSEERAMLVTASATDLPLADSSVDVVLTSPPYLTRIDYAVAYARELAILGYDINTDRGLRSALMGTTLIRKNVHFSASVGMVGESLLRKIAAHDSKASAGYYLKQAQQYLSDLCRGLDEISRVAKEKAIVHLVVQDSFYKDVHVPLADICIDEASMRGWSMTRSEQFSVRRSLVTLNTSARAYKKGDVAESVITFRRG